MARLGRGQSLMAQPLHILLVEDDRDIQMAMLEVLEEEGYSVAVANNGQQALSYLASATALPHVILLDLMMPVMDGFEFRMRMRQVPRFMAVPVIVVSADRNAQQKTELMQVAAFLEKPLNLTDLLDTLSRVMPADALHPA